MRWILPGTKYLLIALAITRGVTTRQQVTTKKRTHHLPIALVLTRGAITRQRVTSTKATLLKAPAGEVDRFLLQSHLTENATESRGLDGEKEVIVSESISERRRSVNVSLRIRPRLHLRLTTITIETAVPASLTIEVGIVTIIEVAHHQV